VEALGLLAVLGGGEVEVTRDAEQLVRPDRGPGAPAAVGDVGLDRPEIAPAVEHHGELLAQRQPADAQRHRDGRIGVDQRPAQQVLWVLVHALPPSSFSGRSYGHWRWNRAGRLRPWG